MRSSFQANQKVEQQQQSSLPRTTREHAINISTPSHNSDSEDRHEVLPNILTKTEGKQSHPDQHYMKRYAIKIDKHTIVDEKEPFVLFALELQSDFSKFVVLKKFTNFVRFNQDLMRFKDQVVAIKRKDNFHDEYRLETLIPRLPPAFTGIVWKSVPSAEKIERQKEALIKYSQAILDLLYKCVHPQTGPSEEEELEEAHITIDKSWHTLRTGSLVQHTKEWVNVILNFFQLQEMGRIEQQRALQLQKFFRNIKYDKIKKRFLQMTYKLKGYTVNLLDINDHILIHILGFLSLKEKFKVAQISREFRDNSYNPSLWREIHIFSRQIINTQKFCTVVHRSSQLRILSLKFCPNVSAECLAIIAEEANPFYLRELYLDGCDKINDAALLSLMGRTRRELELPEEDALYSSTGQIHLKDFSSLAVNQEDLMHIIKDVSVGGARGLEILSLAECRNIFDTGVIHLKGLKYLTKVVLLGCSNVKDDSIKEISRSMKYLEEVDIGGTNVTVESLRELVTMCLNLKKVNITGCKRLNASDDIILKQNKINVEGGEDVFRFYLVPEQYSDLPRITNSVLKTRSTLSLHKVYKYLIKKLQTEHAIEDIPDDYLADQLVEILCNGVVLNPYMQLKHAKEKHWFTPDQLLILNYRRKELQSDIESSNTSIREYYPRKPPLWIPDHLSYACLKCERDFTLLRRIHHCRNCGKCYCHQCCNNWLPIEQYGYFTPVRVCNDCKQIIIGLSVTDQMVALSLR